MKRLGLTHGLGNRDAKTVAMSFQPISDRIGIEANVFTDLEARDRIACSSACPVIDERNRNTEELGELLRFP